MQLVHSAQNKTFGGRLSLSDIRNRKMLPTEFFLVQYIIIIQALLSRKSMNKLTVSDENTYCADKAFDRKKKPVIRI